MFWNTCTSFNTIYIILHFPICHIYFCYWNFIFSDIKNEPNLRRMFVNISAVNFNTEMFTNTIVHKNNNIKSQWDSSLYIQESIWLILGISHEWTTYKYNTIPQSVISIHTAWCNIFQCNEKWEAWCFQYIHSGLCQLPKAKWCCALIQQCIVGATSSWHITAAI